MTEIMTLSDLERLTRTHRFDTDDVIVLRPGLALVMYSYAPLADVMRSTAEVLETYLAFVPQGAVAGRYVPPADEYSPDSFAPFGEGARQQLMRELREGPATPGQDGYGIELTQMQDGQAGDYGFSLGATNFDVAEDADDETSVLRLELPWRDRARAEDVFSLFTRCARLFPFSSGNAGMSFNFTVGYTTAAADAMRALLPRYLGFDSTYGSPQLVMRGKSPGAQWLNLLNAELVAAVGGFEQLRRDLPTCELLRLGDGVMIRAAEYPPVVDVNRGGSDIGALPDVSRVLRSVRLDDGAFAPLGDEERGQAWLERFDARGSGDWRNG